jgi:hypothetical protein
MLVLKYINTNILTLLFPMKGEMCHIIQCGFPFSSEMAHAFPAVLAEHNLRDAEVVKVGDFKRYVEGTSHSPYCFRLACLLKSY